MDDSAAAGLREPFAFDADLGLSPPRILLPPPDSPRAVFELLAELRPGETLDSLLARTSFMGLTAAEIQAQLGAGPAPPGEDAASALRRILTSPEFRAQAVAGFLRAYPELGRDIFIHVPKCAGTDLTLNLAERLFTLPVGQIAPDWIPEQRFVAALAALARGAAVHDRIFVHGHVELGPFLDACGRRAGDRIFTIIRDPIALMVSQANYKIGRLRADPTGRDFDTAETLASLGLRRLPEGITEPGLKDLVVRALLDPSIAAPNLACRHLAHGPGATAADAIDCIAAYDVELTTTGHYEAWLRGRWSIPESERHNRSVPILTVHEARRLFSAYLDRATAEDQILYDLIFWAIERSGGGSVTGQALARMAAPRTIQAHAMNLTARRRAARLCEPPVPVVIEEPPFVALYQHTPAAPLPGGVEVTEVLAAGFGRNGAGLRWLGSGWSAPEDAFVWTDGCRSELTLPACPGRGTLAVRLIGAPFVSGKVLPSQDVVLSVNGWPVGAPVLRDLSVIEFEIPRDLTRAPIAVTIEVPGARAARSVDGADDDRVLGYCLHKIVVIRYVPVPCGPVPVG